MKFFKRKGSKEDQAYSGFISIDSERSLNCSLGDLDLGGDGDKEDPKECLPGVPEDEEDNSTSSTEESLTNEENEPPPAEVLKQPRAVEKKQDNLKASNHNRSMGPKQPSGKMSVDKNDELKTSNHNRGMGPKQPSGRVVLEEKKEESSREEKSPKKGTRRSSILQKAAGMGKNCDNDDDDDASGDEIEEFHVAGAKPKERVVSKQKTSVGKEAAALTAYHSPMKKRASASSPGTLDSLFRSSSRPRERGDFESRSVSSARSSVSRTGRLKTKRNKSSDASDSMSVQSENVSELAAGKYDNTSSLLEDPSASRPKSRQRDGDELLTSSPQRTSRRRPSSPTKSSIQRTRSAEDIVLPFSSSEEKKPSRRPSVQRTRSGEDSLMSTSSSEEKKSSRRPSVQRTRSGEDSLMSTSSSEEKKSSRRPSVQRTRSGEDSLLSTSSSEEKKPSHRPSVQRTRSAEDSLLPISSIEEKRPSRKPSVQRTRSAEEMVLPTASAASASPLKSRMPSREEGGLQSQEPLSPRKSKKKERSQSAEDIRPSSPRRRSTMDTAGFHSAESIELGGDSHSSRQSRRASLAEERPLRKGKKKDKVAKEQNTGSNESQVEKASMETGEKKKPEKKKKKKIEDVPPQKERRPSSGDESNDKQEHPQSSRKSGTESLVRPKVKKEDELSVSAHSISRKPSGQGRAKKEDELSVSMHSVSRKASMTGGQDFLQIDFAKM